jgi:hypothetical protein
VLIYKDKKSGNFKNQKPSIQNLTQADGISTVDFQWFLDIDGNVV